MRKININSVKLSQKSHIFWPTLYINTVLYQVLSLRLFLQAATSQVYPRRSARPPNLFQQQHFAAQSFLAAAVGHQSHFSLRHLRRSNLTLGNCHLGSRLLETNFENTEHPLLIFTQMHMSHVHCVQVLVLYTTVYCTLIQPLWSSLTVSTCKEVRHKCFFVKSFIKNLLKLKICGFRDKFLISTLSIS